MQKDYKSQIPIFEINPPLIDIIALMIKRTFATPSYGGLQRRATEADHSWSQGSDLIRVG